MQVHVINTLKQLLIIINVILYMYNVRTECAISLMIYYWECTCIARASDQSNYLTDSTKVVDMEYIYIHMK